MAEENTVLDRLDVVRLADVESATIKWLWRPYIPFGGISLLIGDPGVGKTHLALLISAFVTTGRVLPTNGITAEPNREAGNVLYLTGEDDLAATIKPRFTRLGGDPERFYAINGIIRNVGEKQIRIGFRLSDLPKWEQVLKQHRPAALFVDPIQAFLGAHVNMNQANEVRPVLDDISKLAAKYGTAVVLLGHSPKAEYRNPKYKVLGSIDMPAMARSMVMAGPNPQQPESGDMFHWNEKTGSCSMPLPGSRFVLVHTKCNFSATGNSVGYVIDEGDLRLTGPVDVTAEQMLAGEGSHPKPREQAHEFLKEFLASGPKSSDETKEAAQQRGIAESTLKRAAGKLGVIRKPEGYQGVWMWSLATSAETGSGAGASVKQECDAPAVVGTGAGHSGGDQK